MINLIEKFIEDIKNREVLLIDKKSSEYKEVYFFQGRDSLLCIEKDSNKILHNIEYDALKIGIFGPMEFGFNTEGEKLFFTMEKNLVNKNIRKEKVVSKEEIANETKKTKSEKVVEETSPLDMKTNTPYKYKDFCDRCNNKKCLEYDTLNGMKHNFGSEDMSEDMQGQYNMYCKKKIEKLGCMNRKTYIK